MSPTPPANRASTIDFHLAESADGWLLTVAVTPALLAALTQQRSEEGDAEFTVSITPNLVPGVAFPTRLALTEPALEAPAPPAVGAGVAAHAPQRRMFRHRERVDLADSG
ncbi:MAG TPA: hypothetical protein VFN57_19650 [Thermomicrobiaceae bacterium]|nr:hypothetical protein [Thermomicrobiaceae bacterium]